MRAARGRQPLARADVPTALASLLAGVRRIELRTRRLVDSRFAGEYHSVFHGQGLEFAEVREYLPGDDVRAIDWNVSARTGTPHIKKFIEERELTVLFAVDVSASARAAGGRVAATCPNRVAEFVALVGASAASNNDRVGLLAFSDRFERFVAPAKGRRHLLRILREMLALAPAGVGTDLAAGVGYAARALRSRSVVFLISDFARAADAARFDRALTVAAVRHDVVPVLMVHHSRTAAPAAGLLHLHDSETGAERVVDTARATQRTWLDDAATADRAVARRLFRRLGLDEVELAVDSDLAKALLAFFGRRARRLGR